MTNELFRLSATEAVARLRRRQISPLELIDAAEARIRAVDGMVNALPTLCLDRARAHARELMAGRRCEAEQGCTQQGRCAGNQGSPGQLHVCLLRGSVGSIESHTLH